MLKGIFGFFGGMVRSLSHGVASRLGDIGEVLGILEREELFFDREGVQMVFDQFENLNVFRSAIDSVESNRLIPGTIMSRRETQLAGKYEYVIKTSYLNPDGEPEDVFMTVASDKRLTPNEVLDDSMIPDCAEMLGMGIDDLEWSIDEGFTSL